MLALVDVGTVSVAVALAFWLLFHERFLRSRNGGGL
jgi:hypothetical protein